MIIVTDYSYSGYTKHKTGINYLIKSILFGFYAGPIPLTKDFREIQKCRNQVLSFNSQNIVDLGIPKKNEGDRDFLNNLQDGDLDNITIVYSSDSNSMYLTFLFLVYKYSDFTKTKLYGIDICEDWYYQKLKGDDILTRKKILSKEEIIKYSNIWKEFVEESEKYPIRMVKEGTIHYLQIDYFDKYFLKQLSQNPCRVTKISVFAAKECAEDLESNKELIGIEYARRVQLFFLQTFYNASKWND